MKIHTGDKVKVITGKDKGTEAKVIKVFPREDMIVVEGVNIKKKHLKAQEGGAPQIMERPYPIHVSNVMAIEGKSGAATRVGYKMVKGKKVRVATKTGNEL